MRLKVPNSPRKRPREIEHQEQSAWFKWFRFQYPDVLAFAVPNGGDRHPAVAKKLKDEGVTAGVPDIFIADGNPGLFIEMKAPKGKLQANQKEIIGKLGMAGYNVAVCYGWEQAKEVTQEYLTGE